MQQRERYDSLLAAGVYPAWHPWLKLIVYSTNKTAQSFHTMHHNKIEVYDTKSDLIAFDIDKGEVTNQTFADGLKGDGEPVKYVHRLSK